MNGVADITIPHFLLIYLLLFIVLAVMKRCQISQTKLLFVASLRMTVQLIIAGFVLMFIFEKQRISLGVFIGILLSTIATIIILRQK